jgi:chromate transporter
MAPIVIALLLSTAWIMASSAAVVAPPAGAGIAAGAPVAAARAAAGPGTDALRAMLAQWPLWLTVIVSCLVIWRTRIHLLWLLAAGAVLGALGLI